MLSFVEMKTTFYKKQCVINYNTKSVETNGTTVLASKLVLKIILNMTKILYTV